MIVDVKASRDIESKIAFSGSEWTVAEKCLGCSLVLVVFFSFITITLLAIAHVHWRDENVCTTPGCARTAALILNNIDTTVDPCHDFFDFACGGLLKSNDIAEDGAMWGQGNHWELMLIRVIRDLIQDDSLKSRGSEATRKTMNLYKTCMDVERVDELSDEPVTAYLAGVNLSTSWPVLADEWNESDFRLTELLARLRRDAASVIYHVAVVTDNRNSTRHVLAIDQASLGLSRKYLLDTEQFGKYVNSYRQYMEQVAGILRASDNVTNVTSEIQQIIDFETDLANVTLEDNSRRNRTRLYNLRTVRNFTASFSAVNWRLYFDILLDDDVTIGDNDTVNVMVPQFMAGVDELLMSQNYDNRTISNYITWRIIIRMASHLNKPYRKALLGHRMRTSGVQAESPRWLTCMGITLRRLPMAMGYIYVNRTFSEQSKVTALELIREIKESFKQRVATVEWMSDKTKRAAIEKIDAVIDKIGYPDFIRNLTLLDQRYDRFNVTDIHFDNIVNAGRFYVRENLLKMWTLVDRSKWPVSPATFNAYYQFSNNAIVFPAGILRPPLFAADQTMYLNFAGIGGIIAHEVSHGFDDQGRQNDKHGNSVSWWEAADIEGFLNRTRCFISQYDNYTIVANNATWHVNGTRTQGESIADSGGLRHSLQAYENWLSRNGINEEGNLPGLAEYTWKQLFFINSAQMWCSKMRDSFAVTWVSNYVHPPDRFRVNGPMSHYPEFAKTWNCPAGSPMNAEKKCVIW